jgi:hypothetical protein
LVKNLSGYNFKILGDQNIKVLGIFFKENRPKLGPKLCSNNVDYSYISMHLIGCHLE